MQIPNYILFSEHFVFAVVIAVFCTAFSRTQNRYRRIPYLSSCLESFRPCHGSGGSCQLLAVEVRVQSHTSPRRICGRQSSNGAGFSPSASVFPCQCHFTSVHRRHYTNLAIMYAVNNKRDT
jgi:hypothetical protein